LPPRFRKIYDVRETLQALIEKLDPREFIRIREVQPWFQGTTSSCCSGEELRTSRYQRDAVDRLVGK
jgi:hypothetical protein